jgi:hypothetical protein
MGSASMGFCIAAGAVFILITLDAMFDCLL